MKRNASILLVFTVIIVSFCTAEAAQPIDQFAVKDQVKWNCAKTISITLFPVVGEFKGKNDLSFYQNNFANKLADRIRKIPTVEKVDVVSDKSNLSADIVIDGNFKDLTTGSRALRFWVSFGAGKSFCRAEMKGIDPKSGAEVFVLDHARGSAMDVVNDDELIENVDEVVEDVAAGLMAARGVCPLSAVTPVVTTK
jgi:hypothetical protein